MKRTLTIAAAALAAVALGAPSAALAGGKSHLLGSYKVEKHLDLEGEEGTYKIKCDGTDIAVDGMWRIDNVDQDNDYVYPPADTGNPGHAVLLGVEPFAAYPSTESEYTFMFVPLAGGDVQGKLFLTCLPRKVTETNGHKHQWNTDGITTDGHTLGAPLGTDTYLATATVSTTPCGAGETAVSPGFKVDDVDHFVKVTAREPGSYTASSGWKDWDWRFFNLGPGTTDVTLYQNCLSRTSTAPLLPATGTHKHKIAQQTRFTPTPSPTNMLANKVTEVQVICGDHYKAMLGAFDLGYDGYVWVNGDHWQKLWYMGMDPRPKVRAYKILNTGLVNVLTGHPPVNPPTPPSFSALCFKDRTT